MTRDDIFPAIVLLLGVLAAGILLGVSFGRSFAANDCDKLGGFVGNDKVYSCEVKK